MKKLILAIAILAGLGAAGAAVYHSVTPAVAAESAMTADRRSHAQALLAIAILAGLGAVGTTVCLTVPARGC